MTRLLAVPIVAVLLVDGLVRAADRPAIPVGLDAYRMWEQWPQQRIGCRGYMRSTYDRSGGNEGADASHFLYQLGEDRNVTLDLEGPGVLYFARFNHWHGSPWHFEVDGVDRVVSETSTGDPNHPTENSTFVPKEAFPEPLAFTWSTTKGADLSWVPMGFEQSLRLSYSRTHYGTGYYIFHRYVPGISLSQPIKAWDAAPPPDEDVLQLISDEAMHGARGNLHAFNRDTIRGHGSTRVCELSEPGCIRWLQVSLPASAALQAKHLRLRITWDGRAEPSVDVPLPLFFGAGTLYNRDGREWLVKAFPVSIQFKDERIELRCCFPMPYFRSARIEIANDVEDVPDVAFLLGTAPLTAAPGELAYFHATYKDHPKPVLGLDLLLLDTRKIEGSEDWTGSFVGTSFIFSHNAVLNTLEGDPRFYFDDARSPQAYGTGTEEWGGGGDYWGGRNMTLPFAGHPCGARSAKEAKSEEDKIESAYRFLLADLFPFGKNATITLEHGGMNESEEHYETVAYWYGLPGASVVQTDLLLVGDERDEAAHAYRSPEASKAYSIESRYEWGPDRVRGEEVCPTMMDTGRTTAGTSEFTVKIAPENLGVMLRRKLDYSFPNQRARVFIAKVEDPSTPSGALQFVEAGVWYLAGSNTCVYSNPKEELGAAQHVVQTSNRRFREDEFLVPVAMTKERSMIRVRVVFEPVKTPLFPGHPLSPLAWSEINYAVYCFVRPKFEAPK